MFKRFKSVSIILLMMGIPSYSVYASTYFNIGNEKILQQNPECRGVVKDVTGQTIIGASVQVKGSSNGTITDLDGKFQISGIVKGDIIEISYIGYLTQEIKWNGDSSELKIILKEDAQALDEVVVVGYGTTTNRAMVASVSKVKAEEMSSLPVSNVSQGMAGRAAGLIVQGSAGGINKVPKISIRGGSTPLVVIDGVIRDYDDFILLSPDDIDVLSILKDASATAVYGSRASNGILQVTTKKGREGKPQVNYAFNYSLSSPSYWKKPKHWMKLLSLAMAQLQIVLWLLLSLR